MNSEIRTGPGGTVFSGPDAVKLFRAATLRGALRLYAKARIQVARNVTPSQLLAMATEFTGKRYKRGEYALAASDVDIWVQTMKAALPVTQTE